LRSKVALKSLGSSRRKTTAQEQTDLFLVFTETFEEIGERSYHSRKAPYILTEIVGEAQKRTDFKSCLRRRPVNDSFDLGWVRLHTAGGYDVPQELYFVLEECTFGHFGFEARPPQASAWARCL
jgi:hypothetical protein